ncbi:hypothetical protein PBRA_001692 [Plasmodiophora brassicae]|uniref:Cyclin-like domain-containing protein n=1 Tax=Plasmodiophora brassicae TaxID=37360 RepID=A0A0G4IZ87_PLABS|nr:hypothetical protein PBRA_001692 [Plasmodiophora brassicae]
MAANFWLSSHCNHWIVSSKKEVEKSNPHDRDMLSAEELYQLRLYFVDFLTTLGTGKHLNLRQRIISTAIVYFKRFYLDQSFIEFDPYLAEECGIHANVMINAAAELIPSFPYTAKHLFECEFFALELLRFDLIVFHPYRPITLYLSHIGLNECLQTAWAIANDSYCTDVCLLYPPHVIAVACIQMAANFHEKDIREWSQKLRIKMDQVFEVIAEILSYYDYRSKHTSEQTEECLQKLRSHTSQFITRSPPSK